MGSLRSLQGKKCSKNCVFSHFLHRKGQSPTNSWAHDSKNTLIVKVKEKIMANKKFRLVLLLMVLSTLGLTVTGCASVEKSVGAMSEKVYNKPNPLGSDSLKNERILLDFQYYVSRDIVLRKDQNIAHVGSREDRYSRDRGKLQIYNNRDTIQLLSTTPGIIPDTPGSLPPVNIKAIAIDRTTGDLRLGVAFEDSDFNLLWFVQNSKKGPFFYLEYTDEANRLIKYGKDNDGKDAFYKVSYNEKAKGLGAFFKRLSSDAEVKKEVKKYENKEPILLYKAVKISTKQRRNLPGRKL